MMSIPKTQSGAILLAVIMLLLIIPVSVLLVFDSTAAKSAAIESRVVETQLKNVLSAAIAHARYAVDTNTTCTGFSGLPVTQFGKHTYQVDVIQDPSQPYLLQLTAYAQLDSGASVTRNVSHIAYQPEVTGERRPQFDLTAHSANPDQSFASTDTLTISNNGFDKSYALLNFDLTSALPPAARIHSALLETTVKSVPLTGDVNNSAWLSAHVISRRWGELATWNSHDGNKFWRPNDGAEPVYATIPIDQYSGIPINTLELDLTGVLRHWLNTKTTFSGVLLRTTNVASSLELYSVNHSDYDAQPHLNLTYSCPCGFTCGIQKRRFYLDSIQPEIDSNTMLRTCNERRDYRGSDGEIRWTFQAWEEINEDDGPCAGSVQIDQDPVVNNPDDWQFKLMGDGKNLRRDVWLQDAEHVVVSFRYRRENLSNANQTTQLVFFNDGVSSVLLTISGNTTDSDYQTASVLVPASLVGPNSSIMFETQNYTANQFIYIDEVKIGFEGPVSPVFGLSITEDAMINEDKPSDSFPNTTPLKLMEEASKNMRILYAIDTDGILPGEIVNEATLRAFVSDSRTDRDATFSLYAITENWDLAKATWEDREANVSAWSTPGGTYFQPPDPADTPSLVLLPGEEQLWLEFDITALVQSWVDFPASNQGVLLIMLDGNRGKEVKIDGLESGDTTKHPRVSLQL